MSNRSLIIGVIGATGDPPAGVPALAKEVGREIAFRHLIVLTGGTMPASETAVEQMAVKEAALWGAATTAGTGRIPRAIGILPKKASRDLGKNPPGIDIVQEGSPGNTVLRCLYVYTNLSSNQRNVINGFVPGALIVLKGGAGTLSEVAFAASYGKPLIFLNSRTYLREEIFGNPALEKDFQGRVREAMEKYSILAFEKISEALKAALEHGRDAMKPSEAVQLAEENAAKTASEPGFPEVPPDTPLEAQFQECFRQLNRFQVSGTTDAGLS